MPQPQQTQLMQVGRTQLDILPSTFIPFSFYQWRDFFLSIVAYLKYIVIAGIATVVVIATH